MVEAFCVPQMSVSNCVSSRCDDEEEAACEGGTLWDEGNCEDEGDAGRR